MYEYLKFSLCNVFFKHLNLSYYAVEMHSTISLPGMTCFILEFSSTEVNERIAAIKTRPLS